jgi:hypothetical protein
VQRVLSVERAVFVQFQLFLGIPPVFLGGVVSSFALGTLHGDDFNRRLLACHNYPLIGFLSSMRSKKP